MLWIKLKLNIKENFQFSGNGLVDGGLQLTRPESQSLKLVSSYFNVIKLKFRNS